MPQFPLFKRPSRLVFLDDDTFCLQILKVALPPDWRADLFLDSSACLSYLKKNGAALLLDESKQYFLLNESSGSLQAGQNASKGNVKSNVITELVNYWQHNPARYDLVNIAVFDYAMPGVNGLDAFELLGNWPGRRVLLTGQADESLAVQAFNQNLIHQFISKQGRDLRDSLLFQLPHLLAQPLPAHQFLWLNSLTLSQRQWLSEPSVVQALNAWASQSDWIEYAVTSAPFGLLGVNAKGVISWLQLAFASELEQSARVSSQQGLDSKSVTKVQNGVSLVNTVFCAALGVTRPIATSIAFKLGCNSFQAEQQGDSAEELLGALWYLGESYDLRPDASYDAWRIANPTQII